MTRASSDGPKGRGMTAVAVVVSFMLLAAVGTRVKRILQEVGGPSRSLVNRTTGQQHIPRRCVDDSIMAGEHLWIDCATDPAEPRYGAHSLHHVRVERATIEDTGLAVGPGWMFHIAADSTGSYAIHRILEGGREPTSLVALFSNGTPIHVDLRGFRDGPYADPDAFRGLEWSGDTLEVFGLSASQGIAVIDRSGRVSIRKIPTLDADLWRGMPTIAWRERDHWRWAFRTETADTSERSHGLDLRSTFRWVVIDERTGLVGEHSSHGSTERSAVSAGQRILDADSELRGMYRIHCYHRLGRQDFCDRNAAVWDLVALVDRPRAPDTAALRLPQHISMTARTVYIDRGSRYPIFTYVDERRLLSSSPRVVWRWLRDHWVGVVQRDGYWALQRPNQPPGPALTRIEELGSNPTLWPAPDGGYWLLGENLSIVHTNARLQRTNPLSTRQRLALFCTRERNGGWIPCGHRIGALGLSPLLALGAWLAARKVRLSRWGLFGNYALSLLAVSLAAWATWELWARIATV